MKCLNFNRWENNWYNLYQIFKNANTALIPSSPVSLLFLFKNLQFYIFHKFGKEKTPNWSISLKTVSIGKFCRDFYFYKKFYSKRRAKENKTYTQNQFISSSYDRLFDRWRRQSNTQPPYFCLIPFALNLLVPRISLYQTSQWTWYEGD